MMDVGILANVASLVEQPIIPRQNRVVLHSRDTKKSNQIQMSSVFCCKIRTTAAMKERLILCVHKPAFNNRPNRVERMQIE